MKFFRMIAAASLAAATLATTPAGAAPVGPAPVVSDGLVVQVRGCHRNPERHFVPEFGRRAWHIHRGRNCRPVQVDRPGVGPIPLPTPVPRDCHRNARRHFLPEYGRSVVHRHVGPNCRIRVLRRSQSFRPGACVSIGPVTFCD